MPTWQRRARLLIAVAAVAFAIVVAVAFRPRTPQPAPEPIATADPEALVESAAGLTFRVNRDREEVRVEYDRLLTYADGLTKVVGMKITTERAGGRTFVLTGREGAVRQDPAAYDIAGDVELTSSDGLRVSGNEASYSEEDGLVRAPGPVTFSRGRMSGTSTGLTYDKDLDTLTLLADAVVTIAPNASGVEGLALRAERVEIWRAGGSIRFDGGMEATRDAEVIRADAAVAQLGSEEGQLERLELRGRSRIEARTPSPGGLQTLAGQDMDLEYGADGVTFRRADIRERAEILLAGERGRAGTRITASYIDVSVADDGVTLDALRARERVSLVLPPAAATRDAAARTVTADTFDLAGQGPSGRQSADGPAGRFRGSVVYREAGGSADRTVRAEALDAGLAPGLAEFRTARFTGGVHFTDGATTATAEEAAYAPGAGTLDLRPAAGRAAPVPRLVTERLAVEAAAIDVTLAGPRILARGDVKSELTFGAGGTQHSGRRTPSLLSADHPVIVVSDSLVYDGGAAQVVYDGHARLSQGDTSIKAAAIEMHESTGNLEASGDVVTTTVLEQTTGDRRERVPSIGRAGRFTYEESDRLATYEDEAQVGGPHGEMRAARIELYLRPGVNEIERVEAYEKVTLLEQRRRTAGSRLTYFSADNRYVVVGSPVTIIDDCGRETIGRTLTFLQNTDRVVVDGNEQIRTRTTGASACP